MKDLRVTYQGVVYPWHCDHMGHMNVMWYVGKFDEATWRLCAMIGLTPRKLQDAGRGMAAVEQHVRYRREFHAGDTVTITSTILSVSEKSIRMRHEMIADELGEVGATMELVGVHLDKVTRRACALPQGVREQALSLAGALGPV